MLGVVHSRHMTACAKEFRCTSCHKLLFKGILVEGDLEAKCKHCHEINHITSSQFNDLLCLIPKCPHRITLNVPS